MTDPIISALLTRISDLEKSALEQPAPDFPSYRERIGQYKGLKEALQIILAQYEEDDKREF